MNKIIIMALAVLIVLVPNTIGANVCEVESPIVSSLFKSAVKKLVRSSVKGLIKKTLPKLGIQGAKKITVKGMWESAKDKLKTPGSIMTGGVYIVHGYNTFTLEDRVKAGMSSYFDRCKQNKSVSNSVATNIELSGQYGVDSVRCIRLLSTFQEYCKMNAWEEAYPSWTILFKEYPKCSQTIYSNGVNIVKKKMQLAKTGKEQQIWVDTLMMVYDQRIKYFAPISKLYGEAYLLGRKGVDLYKYRKASMETAYNILKKSIELGGKNSEYAVIQTAMQLVVAMYNSNKIDASVVVEKYILLSDLLGQKKVDDNTKLATATDDETRTRAQRDLATCAQVENNIFCLFSNSTAAQCNVLIQTFSEKLKSSPNDIGLCEKIVRILDLKGCTNSQLYEDAIKKIVAKHPSESACFELGKNLERKGEIDDAIENYKKAIAHASTDANVAIYNCSIAKLFQKKKQYVDARSYARKAIALNPNYGLPYIIIATMYGDNPVGNSSFEKSLTYWLVIDKLQKAKSVDPSIADEAQQLIDRYSSVCPKKEESFIHSIISGKTVTIGGWINETTTARF